jgi:D-alanine-D-alanine ligase
MSNTPGRRLTIAVIFGGRSVEHDVSIVTGQQVIRALNPARYEVVPIYITREGKWLSGPALADIKTFQNENIAEQIGIRETMLSCSVQYQGVITPPVAGYLARNQFKRLDAAFPAIHGTHGEDGTIQGLFEMGDVPYVGCGVLASAVANDKIVMKSVLKAIGVPVVEHIAFGRGDWARGREALLDKFDALGYPLFVKPATLGSSIGIGRPGDRRMAIASVEVALGFDRRVLVEQAVEGAIEVNCALMGNSTGAAGVRASVLEQPISFDEFLSYEDKYMRGGAGKGMKGAERKIPAPIPDALTKQIQDMSIEAFKAIDGRGTARLDFLVKDGQPYLNEINTMPGSLAFYLWQAEGMSPAQVVDELIRLGLEAHAEKRRTIYNYRSGLVDHAAARRRQYWGSARGVGGDRPGGATP